MWKCGYRYLSSEKLHKICQLVPTLQIREQLVNIWVFSAVSCSFLNASIHFLWTLNYAMTEYRIILLTANFSICSEQRYSFCFVHCREKSIPPCNCTLSACCMFPTYTGLHNGQILCSYNPIRHCMQVPSLSEQTVCSGSPSLESITWNVVHGCYRLN